MRCCWRSLGRLRERSGTGNSCRKARFSAVRAGLVWKGVLTGRRSGLVMAGWFWSPDPRPDGTPRRHSAFLLAERPSTANCCRNARFSAVRAGLVWKGVSTAKRNDRQPHPRRRRNLPPRPRNAGLLAELGAFETATVPLTAAVRRDSRPSGLVWSGRAAWPRPRPDGTLHPENALVLTLLRPFERAFHCCRWNRVIVELGRGG